MIERVEAIGYISNISIFSRPDKTCANGFHLNLMWTADWVDAFSQVDSNKHIKLQASTHASKLNVFMHWMEGKVMYSRSIGCLYNLPIKKCRNEKRKHTPQPIGFLNPFSSVVFTKYYGSRKTWTVKLFMPESPKACN